MRVHCLAVCEMVLPSGSTRQHPRGWVGDVDNETAAAWIDAGVAKIVKVVPELTDEQREVLAEAANQALEEQADDGFEEEADTSDAAPSAIGGSSLTELRAMAVARGIKGAARMKRDDLVAALG